MPVALPSVAAWPPSARRGRAIPLTCPRRRRRGRRPRLRGVAGWIPCASLLGAFSRRVVGVAAAGRVLRQRSTIGLQACSAVAGRPLVVKRLQVHVSTENVCSAPPDCLYARHARSTTGVQVKMPANSFCSPWLTKRRASARTLALLCALIESHRRVSQRRRLRSYAARPPV